MWQKDVSTFSKNWPKLKKKKKKKKNGQIGVSIIFSIPHCPTDEAQARLYTDVFIFSTFVSHENAEAPKAKCLLSLVFHTKKMGKIKKKWPKAECLSWLVFHTVLLTSPGYMETFQHFQRFFLIIR